MGGYHVVIYALYAFTMQTSTPVAPAAAPSSLFDAHLFLEGARPLHSRGEREKPKSKKTVKRRRREAERGELGLAKEVTESSCHESMTRI